MDIAKAEAAGEALANALDVDVLFYNGEVSRKSCQKFVNVCSKRRKRGAVLLTLVTPGGDPDAAYKIGRHLQSSYPRKVSICIPGWCKSAGTLITLAASELYIGDLGELGPLDIQIAKPDEILEMGSGLTVDAAMKTLEATASRMFLNVLMSIRRDTQGMITTRTAADLAATVVTRLLEPIYRQIDPSKIGENSRAVNITKSYGVRLATTSGILKTPRTIEYLVSAYPDHGFVIDRQEAAGLFTCVREPTLPRCSYLLRRLVVKASPHRQASRKTPVLDSSALNRMSKGVRLMSAQEARRKAKEHEQREADATARLQGMLEEALADRLLTAPDLEAPPTNIKGVTEPEPR